MKQIKFPIVALTLAVSFAWGMLSVPASFSQSAAMIADIPFTFYAAGQLMPAGKYRVQAASVGSSVMLISDNKEHSIFVSTMPTANRKPSIGRLVFNRYGSVNLLSELDWVGNDTGRALMKTSYERELIASSSNSKVRVVLVAK